MMSLRNQELLTAVVSVQMVSNQPISLCGDFIESVTGNMAGHCLPVGIAQEEIDIVPVLRVVSAVINS